MGAPSSTLVNRVLDLSTGFLLGELLSKQELVGLGSSCSSASSVDWLSSCGQFCVSDLDAWRSGELSLGMDLGASMRVSGLSAFNGLFLLLYCACE